MIELRFPKTLRELRKKGCVTVGKVLSLLTEITLAEEQEKLINKYDNVISLDAFRLKERADEQEKLMVVIDNWVRENNKRRRNE